MSRRVTKFLVTSVLVLAVAVTVWTWFSLNWSYSDGDRAGVLQKFSKKGWICKTYEGELALYLVAGVGPEIWYFSTRDEALAAELTKTVGQRIQLHYAEHKGVPTNCFAETPYYAKSFTVIPEK